MLNFLLDITPDKSQLLITIKLAGILREKKQEVYYTYRGCKLNCVSKE